MIGKNDKNTESIDEYLQYAMSNRLNTAKTYPLNAKILKVKFWFILNGFIQILKHKNIENKSIT